MALTIEDSNKAYGQSSAVQEEIMSMYLTKGIPWITYTYKYFAAPLIGYKCNLVKP